MIIYNDCQYHLVKRKALKGEFIQTQIYICEEYPSKSVLKVEKVSTEFDEIMACPIQYEEGMKCFGIKVFLEHDDYLVLEEIR